MIPSEYRLEHVCARLVERLEGTRRAYTERPEQAGEAFERVADEHVAAAMSELAALAYAPADEVAAHAEFVGREVRGVFLPRYVRAATAQNARESKGFGFGALAEPLGRVALAVGAVIAFLVLARAAMRWWPAWALAILVLSSPVWPDLTARAWSRRFERELGSILEDLARIQEQARAYARPEQLRTDVSDEAPSRARPQTTRREVP